MKHDDIKKIYPENMNDGVASFIWKHLKRKNIDGHNVLMISDANVLKGIANEGSFDCILSTAALNDYVQTNESLVKIRKLLSRGGTFIGNVETNEQYNKRINGRFNAIVAPIVVAYGFLFRRVMPKLCGFRFLHERLGIVQHHILSKCEALGRLRYCGFAITALEEIDNRLHFVARKSSPPMNGKPTDGLFIKIRKVGLHGRTIHCYKLRTMHAYANYLHDYVLDNLEIDNNGKVIGDFRVPTWGKILRKLWLDEMPQLLNILKGELSFIGLRHLSREFMELYPEDWRKERLKIRPGFVPPYYADCPRTFEEIIESEKKYCKLKKRHPITTDVYYFIRVVISFLTVRARTG